MEVKDGKEDLLRELIIGLSPMVTNVEALKGQLYIYTQERERLDSCT